MNRLESGHVFSMFDVVDAVFNLGFSQLLFLKFNQNNSLVKTEREERETAQSSHEMLPHLHSKLQILSLSLFLYFNRY